MIADFVIDRMSGYVAGGMKPETAAGFARGELAAIYRGDHRSRDGAGQWRVTPPSEAVDAATAAAICDGAIAEILGICAEGTGAATVAPPKKTRSVYHGSAALRQALAAGVGVKDFFAKSGDNDPDAYTTDLDKIAALWNGGQRRYKALIRGRFLALDIDCKPGKEDGLEELYRLFPKDTLPRALQDIEGFFPCYVKSPSGYHLYFCYDGPEVKTKRLAPGVEVKDWQITAPGSRKENGDYVLHGELEDAPPLYGIIIDRMGELQMQKQEKADAQRAVADRPVSPPRRAARGNNADKPRITLEALANEAAAAYAGNHDRQVSFAGRACRCKFSAADAVSYAKSNPAVFGSGADTEHTIRSVFQDNGGM